MPTTSPDNIYYADGSTPMSAETISAAEATSVQDALDALIHDTRQIQTFVWANSAARSSQAGMIAGDLGYQTDTGLTYRYNGSSWVAFYPGGMIPIVPTGVSGTGVSRNTTTGLVTFTNSPSVSLDGCFTSAFRNYRVLVDITSAANIAGMRMRASGADNSTSNYDRQTDQGTVATASAANAVGQTQWGAVFILSASHTEGSADLTVFNPRLAVRTRLTGNVYSSDATTATAVATIGARHRATTQFDGFSIIPGSGNVTGTLMVYGLA